MPWAGPWTCFRYRGASCALIRWRFFGSDEASEGSITLGLWSFARLGNHCGYREKMKQNVRFSEALVLPKHLDRDAPLGRSGVSCLAPPLRSGAKQPGASGCVQSAHGATRASLVPPLRSGTKLALAYSGIF